MEAEKKAKGGDEMTSSRENSWGGLAYRPTVEWIERHGSVERAYEQALERLKGPFEMEALLHFIDLAFDLHRVDQVDHWLSGEEPNGEFWTAYMEQWATVKENLEWITNHFSRNVFYYLVIQTLFAHKEYEKCLETVNQWRFNQTELEAGQEARVGETNLIWVYRMRGLVYEKLGNEEKAKQDWQAVLEGNPGNPNLFAEALSLLDLPPYKPYRIAFRCHSRFFQNQFHRTEKNMPEEIRAEMEKHGLGLGSVYTDPLTIDTALALESEDQLKSLAGTNRIWVEFFADWHHGDYESCEELLVEIQDTWKPEYRVQWYGYFIALWRLMWVRGEYGLLFESIQENEDQFSAESLPVEMHALKAFAVAKRAGVEGARAGFELLRVADQLHCSSRFGELGFDGFLYTELAMMAGEESFSRRIMDRMLGDEPMREWAVGRYSESWGQFRVAKKAYESLLGRISDKHPGYYLRGQALERLALLCLDLGMLESGMSYEKQLGDFCVKYHPNHQDLLSRKEMVKAKRLYVTGHYLDAIELYERHLTEARREGRVTSHTYQLWSHDYIAILLALGQLSAAKTEIDQLPKKQEKQILQHAKFAYEWAELAGEPEVMQHHLAIIRKGIEGIKDAVALSRSLSLLLFRHEEKTGTLAVSTLRLLKTRDVNQHENPLDFQIAFALVRGRWILKQERDCEYEKWIDDRLSAVGRPPLLQAEWLKIQAVWSEMPARELKERFQLLKDNLGLGNVTAMDALLDLDSRDVERELIPLMAAAKTALKERVGLLPTERQLIFARDLLAIYDRTAVHVLALGRSELTAALYSWTRTMKGLPLRIQRQMAIRMRDKDRRRDFRRFALLSQQILEGGRSEYEEDRQAWIKERESLMEGLGIYEDRIFADHSQGREFELPMESTVIEIVETLESVYRWRTGRSGSVLENLGSRQAWEMQIRQFRRKLLRNQADFEVLGTAVFGSMEAMEKVLFLPDGMFYGLPFYELAAALDIRDFEVGPSVVDFHAVKRKVRWDKGFGFFAFNYQTRSALPAVERESETLWRMGLQAYEAPKHKASFEQDYSAFFHFSGHGEYVGPAQKGVLRNPFVESRLLLPGGNMVTALDLSAADWTQCPLVVLNACESGSGAHVPMQGLLGLSYGLFLGGAESVVVTLYPVTDQAAEWFSSTFYETLLSTGNRMEALASAKERMRMEGIAEKEIAAFQLMGAGFVLEEAWMSRMVRWMRKMRRKWR